MEEEQGDYHHKAKKTNNKNGFAQYSFFSELFLNIMINKLKNPTPVQKKALPLVMEGKDVVACYKTGSGKTLAYILPMINKLQSHSQIVGARALILIPTRDLADQITKVLKTFLHKIDLKYSLILGGHTYEGQFESLSSNPDIIIATPGRLMQLLAETDLKLSRVQLIVFDEADQLFGQNKFQKELKEILSKCPTSQRLMFSATITPDLNEFALAGLRDYCYIHQDIALPQKMKIDFFIIRPDEKVGALLYLLERIVKREKVIIFVSTRFHVDFLVSVINEVHPCFGIYGKMDMEERTSSMDAFRRKRNSILIVTDVAARGLDIPEVKYVIHYDYPSNHQIFVHRSGRTARAEQSGNTIALITYHELSYLTELATFITKKLDNTPNKTDCINYGVVPPDILIPYINRTQSIINSNQDNLKFKEMADRAFEKFKKCRTQTSQNSMKKAKMLALETHHHFAGDLEEQEQQFLKKIKSFTPKKSFLELQKISLDKEPETDPFLGAIQKIRKQQNNRNSQLQKRQKLRQSNSKRWKQILDKKQLQEYESYRETLNNQRLPIQIVEGVEIELGDSKLKKSFKKDFKNPSQYISNEKNPHEKTQFDDLPRIKATQIDENLEDENIKKNNKAKRVWDKTKMNFIWKKDVEDKMSKDKKGKKAYDTWKKKSKLSIPQVGQTEDAEQINLAKDSWLQRRKYRHGWKENKEGGEKRRINLKNNKTKAVEKKYKKKLISKASKGARGKSSSKSRFRSR